MAGGVVEWTLLVGLVIWFCLSVVGQIGLSSPSSTFQRPRRWDLFGLIPVWTFFAPRPSWTDYHLLYRDRLMDGSISPWTEVLAVERRRWWHVVWNPGKHSRKGVTDMLRMFTRELDQTRTRSVDKNPELVGQKVWQAPVGIFTSLPYVGLLHLVSEIPRLPGAAATQFLIMKCDVAQSGEFAVMLLSAFHEL